MVCYSYRLFIHYGVPSWRWLPNPVPPAYEQPQAILTGPKRENFNDMCKRHTHDFVDLMAGRLRPLVQHMIGEKEFVGLKDEIAQQMIENLPVAIR